MLLVVLAVEARFDFEYLGGVGALVETMSDPVHLREAAAPDLPQILKLLLEALSFPLRTLSCEILLKSKPSIDKHYTLK
jgi:hypothetical protein